ncbi:hypothetical protein HMPREF9162_0688 [Selenomonas sp. oral taxon 137 str. F0430]|nr:conserved domain protein [Selenomonas sp. oral taxon 137]EFR41533.1 hypothetical protein HMPREF9162_0688 [Selenomonas sp. oral taxon 137 str. F0430]
MDYAERIRAVIAREMGNTASESVRFLKNIQAKPKLCLWGLGSHGYNWRGYLKSLGIHADYVYDASPEARAAWIGTEHRIETRAELTALLPEMAVLVTMRNAAPVMGELRALGTNAFAATVNFFSFDACLRYEGHPEMLRTMEREALALLELCADDTSREIVCQTIEKDFDEAHVGIDCIPDQYFVPSIMPLTDEECFVDVGAYDGDTMDAFLRAVHGKYRHIYAFEMSRRNFAKLSHKGTTDPRYDAEKISPYPYGCSNTGVDALSRKRHQLRICRGRFGAGGVPPLGRGAWGGARHTRQNGHRGRGTPCAARGGAHHPRARAEARHLYLSPRRASVGDPRADPGDESRVSILFSAS